MKRIIKSLDELKKFAQEIEKNIFWFSNILIYWEIWSWKTTLTKYFLENIWVEKKIKSPSYALENFYKIENSKKYKNIWHYDIYRLSQKQNLESLEENFNSDDLVLVERAEKLNSKPQSWIELHFKKLPEKNLETWENFREIEIKFFWTSFTEKEIQKIFEKYKTPINIQWHTAQVANTAIQIVENFIKNWKILDKKLIYTAARLHDIIKHIDFVEKIKPVKTKNKLEYFDILWNKIPKENIILRKKTRKQFLWLTHEKAWAKLFYDLWFKEIWRTILSHWLMQAFEWFWTFEEKILYYADSVTMHHKKVSVKERIEDIKIRYWNWSKEEDLFYNKLIEKNLEVERDLEKFVL
jgi:tRNA threonylcarbamoyl adenosine modification protein YjeE